MEYVEVRVDDEVAIDEDDADHVHDELDSDEANAEVDVEHALVETDLTPSELSEADLALAEQPPDGIRPATERRVHDYAIDHLRTRRNPTGRRGRWRRHGLQVAFHASWLERTNSSGRRMRCTRGRRGGG